MSVMLFRDRGPPGPLMGKIMRPRLLFAGSATLPWRIFLGLDTAMSATGVARSQQ